MRWLTIAAALAALALGLTAAGCGGGDDEASDEPDTTLTETETDETTDETTTDGETTDDTGSDDPTGFDFSSEECQQLAAAGSEFGQAFSGATTGEDLSDEADAFQEFADNAPEEIREDMQTLADAYEEIIAALADVDLDPGATPTAEQIAALTQALSSIDQTGVQGASERIATWAQENCSTTG
jgi:hypothetical protein